MARVFLYRAIHRQRLEGHKTMTGTMAAEFNNALMIEADFAYFDAREISSAPPGIYEYPFYSSRFATALLLQAVLEVEDQFVPAPRMIRWLLETQPYEWFATQSNFWILYAANEYFSAYEKEADINTVLKLLGDTYTKTFSQDDTTPLNVEKSLQHQQDEFTLTLNASRPVYLTTQLTYKIEDPPAKSRGLQVTRNVYDESGLKIDMTGEKSGTTFEKGKRYMVELVITPDKEVPFGVIDEPLAAGFQGRELFARHTQGPIHING